MQASDRIGRRLKLHDLHALMCVAQAGSMSKAAKLMNTTQSAVSRSIAELEHAFGVPLLDRHAGGVEPTSFGRALLDGGTAVFDDLRQAVRQIEFLADPTVGEVRVGGPSSMVESFFPVAIARLNRRYPKLAVEVLQYASGPAMYQNLRERNADLIVGRAPVRGLDGDLNVETLLPEPLCVVVGAQNAWAKRRRVKLSDLMGEQWVLTPSDSPPRILATEMFRTHGLDVPRPTVVTSSMSLMHALVVSGPFVTVLPGSVVRFRINKPPITVVHTEANVDAQPISVVTLKRRSLSPSAGHFIDALRDVIMAANKLT